MPPSQLSRRQTAAASNNFQAQANAAIDPRYMVKQFDRAGFSRGAGQAAYGAAKGAEAYADLMNKSASVGMQDDYYNANQALDAQSRNQQFGLALAGLQEDVAQDQFNANISTINSMMAPMKNALKGLTSTVTGAASGGLMPQSSQPSAAPRMAPAGGGTQSPFRATPSPTDGQRNITTFVAGRGPVTTTVPKGGNLAAYRTQHQQAVASAKAPKMTGRTR